MNFRRILLWVHRWVGVIAGVFVLAVAITGGVLVFERTLDHWMNPQLYPKTADTKRIPIEQALANLRQEHPEMRVIGIKLPRDDADALVLHTGSRMTQVDPHTGQVLGSRPSREGFFRTVTKLHVNLMSGPTGNTIVVVTTMVIIGLALSGLWLWWPLKIGWFRRGVNFRRFNLDLHSVAGLYSSLFLLVLATTGLTLRYLHHEHPRPPQSTPPVPARDRITVDEAIAKAEAALPGAHVVSLEMPPPMPRAPFHLQLAFPEDGSPAGRSLVFLNQFTGEVLAVHSAREGTLLDLYQNLQLSLHTGTVCGWPTLWIAFSACLALVLQVLSGYVLWWKRA